MGMEKYLDKAYAFSRTLILLLRQNLDQPKFLESVFEKVEENCKILSEHLKRDGPHRFCRGVYREVDKLIEEQKQEKPEPPISCRRGCSHCCKMYVAATTSEAKHLSVVAAVNEIPINIERLKKQSQKTDDTWTELSYEDQACVFLNPETNECNVYNDRPLSCRKYFVFTDPQICDIQKNPGGIAGTWFNIDAEIVSTAWMTVDGCGNLASLLLKEEQE